MKLTYTSYGKTTTIETDSDDIDIDELGQMLHSLCLSQNWSPFLLKSIFKKNITNGES
jgi:hypothetical protein